jgi:hypothetical protein
MSLELFYTSAVRGVKPGSQGFCTVALTHGMSAALIDRLEALSAYRPVYPPHDDNAALNPVLRAHYRLGVGGKAVHVLSRVAPCGLDYSRRPNKLAHHVALDPAELSSAGPAWLLSQPGFLEAEWDGEVCILPHGPKLPRGAAPPRECQRWRQVTGDAGWAGALLEALRGRPERPAYLVYEPGMDPLPLLAEAIALLPAEERWKITFSTYYAGLPQGVECACRCVLSDSPEAAEAARLPGAFVLPLRRTGERAPDGDLARMAQTGRGRSVPRTARARAAEEEAPIPVPSPPLAQTIPAKAPAPDEEEETRVNDRSPQLGGRRSPAPPPPPRMPGRGSSQWLLVGLAAGLLGGAGLTAAVGGAVWVIRERGKPAEASAPPTVAPGKGLAERALEGLDKIEDLSKGDDQPDADARSLKRLADGLEQLGLKTLGERVRNQGRRQRVAEKLVLAMREFARQSSPSGAAGAEMKSYRRRHEQLQRFATTLLNGNHALRLAVGPAGWELVRRRPEAQVDLAALEKEIDVFQARLAQEEE